MFAVSLYPDPQWVYRRSGLVEAMKERAEVNGTDDFLATCYWEVKRAAKLRVLDSESGAE
jgi:hypothetical protein